MIWEWIHAEEDHVYDGEYHTDTSNLDGEELPYGLFVSYEDGGPQYSVFDYFPHWHFENTIEQLEDSYEALPDGGNPVAYAWYDRSHGIPIFDDLGAGQPYILFDSPGDAKRFIYEYVDRYGLEDVSHIDLFELEVKRKADAKDLIDIPPRELDEENFDESEQSGLSDY